MLLNSHSQNKDRMPGKAHYIMTSLYHHIPIFHSRLTLCSSKPKGEGEFHPSPFPSYLSLLFLFFAVSLSSCAHLTHLDEAQDSFNRGATLENEIKLQAEVAPTISPAFHYSRAYVSLNKSLKGRRKKKLRKDQLLGHAYSLKALCEWKLGQHETAIQSGNAAKRRFMYLSGQGISMSRDLVLMKALPAIIAIDTIAQEFFEYRAGRLSAELEPSLSFYHTYIFGTDTLPAAHLQSAFSEIELLKKETANNPELRAYLIMVQLSALKTWNGCLSMLFERSISRLSMQEQLEVKASIIDEEKAYFNQRRDQLLQELEQALQGEGERKERIVKYWRGLM